MLTSRELSGQDQAKFYDEITNILRVLVQSTDSDDKLCGVLIIGKRDRQDLLSDRNPGIVLQWIKELTWQKNPYLD